MIPFVDLKAQYSSIKQEVDDAIARVLDKCQFVLGDEVEAFEAEFAAYCQTKHAVGVNSGTSALHLALLATGIKPGDEVITVSFTFVATAAAIRYTGATPVFVDVDPRSFTIDPAKLEAAISPRTKAVVPVHLYGQCADMRPVMDIARKHRLIVIEDAAQAHGAEYENRRAGSLGDLACFSFYPGKNLGAYGEGGAITTNDPGYDKALRVLRDHGQTAKYHHEVIGYNYRLEGIQGAVLRVKLRHLEEWNDARRRLAALYRQLLVDAGVRLVEEMSYGKPVYHVFPILTDHRDALAAHLKTSAIATGIHYPIPVHLQPAFADLGYKAGDLPITERAARQTLSLPMYPELSKEDASIVAQSLCRFGKH
ncbi:MAG TPA: DegT/DnrJ/EryC1/StrS family aminotransferase [Blastocatellia bacterium]|nr:DegT/DnrJ/EryC1/StrS family aminotransferase [Blastocatellia bacterium]